MLEKFISLIICSKIPHDELINMVYLFCSDLLLFCKKTWKNCTCCQPLQNGVYLGVRTCEIFLCFVTIVRVRVYYVNFFVFFVLRHW